MWPTFELSVLDAFVGDNLYADFCFVNELLYTFHLKGVVNLVSCEKYFFSGALIFSANSSFCNLK